MALIGYWKLNGDALDYSGYDNHGTEVNAVYDNDGKYDGSFSNPNGASQYIEIPSNTRIQTIYDQTISMWLYPTSNSVRRNPWNKSYAGEGTMTHETSGAINYYYGTGGYNTGTYTSFGTRSSLPLNQWTHICLVRKYGYYIRWYINGLLDNERTAPYATSAATTQSLFIGTGYTTNYYGKICEVRLFDHAISRDYAKLLAEDERPSDFLENDLRKSKVFHMNTDMKEMIIDGSGNESIISNYTYHTGKGVKNTYSRYFSGYTSNYIRSNARLGREYTISLRLKKHSHVLTTYPIFLSYGLPYIACNGASYPIRFSYTGSSGQRDVSGTTAIQLDTWYTVTITHSGTNVNLYVNGVLEGSNTDTNGDSGDLTFDFGRHLNSDAYRIHGEIEDIQIYSKAISADDVLDIHQNKTRMKIFKDGRIFASNIEEEIEWTLMDNFISSNDEGFSQYEASDALGGHAIQSASDLTAAGWTHSVPDIDSTSYTRPNGFLQLFYGGGTTGYIEKTLPDGYEYVKAIWGNWYGGTSRIYVGGTEVQQCGNIGATTYTGKYNSGDTIKFTEAGIFWVSDIWVGKKRTKNSFQKVQVPAIIHDKSRIVEYNKWVEGTSGSQFELSRNGTDAESRIIVANDPWGIPTKVWDTPSNDSTSDADGGFNSILYPIDVSYYYRFSIWVNRMITGNGHFYFGTHNYRYSDGANINLYQRSNGAGTTNPYFTVNANWAEWGASNRWYLAVAHVFPAGSGTGSNYEFSGIYDDKGSLIYTADQVDFYWDASAGYTNIRAYLYYSTTTTTRQRFAYPRIDKLDGTQPSVQDLINGFSDVIYSENNFINIPSIIESYPIVGQDCAFKKKNNRTIVKNNFTLI